MSSIIDISNAITTAKVRLTKKNARWEEKIFGMIFSSVPLLFKWKKSNQESQNLLC